jgi:hypothetical protein
MDDQSDDDNSRPFPVYFAIVPAVSAVIIAVALIAKFA